MTELVIVPFQKDQEKNVTELRQLMAAAIQQALLFGSAEIRLKTEGAKLNLTINDPLEQK